MKHTKCYIAGYPRPQLVRSDWKDLCGEWKFAFGEEASAEDAFEEKLPRVIRVPFSYECKASGIGEETPHSTVWYSRTIEGKTGKRAILHFDGADYDTEVYINRRLVGRHRGAYSRFSFDVTDYLTEEKKYSRRSLRRRESSRPSARQAALGKRKFRLLVRADDGDL